MPEIVHSNDKKPDRTPGKSRPNPLARRKVLDSVPDTLEPEESLPKPSALDVDITGDTFDQGDKGPGHRAERQGPLDNPACRRPAARATLTRATRSETQRKPPSSPTETGTTMATG